jgi:hypothetical protein
MGLEWRKRTIQQSYVILGGPFRTDSRVQKLTHPFFRSELASFELSHSTSGAIRNNKDVLNGDHSRNSEDLFSTFELLTSPQLPNHQHQP